MAKQNNSLTELQALEGIYEHLSTIDDLAKEVGMISTRLRKIEERLKEPVNITDPTLVQDLTRDTCIYGSLAKSMETCLKVKEQNGKLNDITLEIKQIESLLESVKHEQQFLNNFQSDLQTALIEIKSQCHFYVHFIFGCEVVSFVAVLLLYFFNS